MITVLLPAEVPPIENELGMRNKSVIQITAGEKYLITKSVNIPWTVEEIKSTYGKYMRGGILESNLFYDLVRHIHKSEDGRVKIDILFTSTDGYQVLKKELELLRQHYGKKGCMNKNDVPYIPKTTAAKKGSNWLSPNQFLNFMKLIKKSATK